MYYETIDGELCIMDDQDQLLWTFERGNFSRAFYKFATHWVLENTCAISDNPSDSWAKAEYAWSLLSPEEQQLYVSEVLLEQQSAKDLCHGLLANLNFYQGVKHVKKAFETAIKSVRRTFTD
jgi:hypothetical protein